MAPHIAAPVPAIAVTGSTTEAAAKVIAAKTITCHRPRVLRLAFSFGMGGTVRYGASSEEDKCRRRDDLKMGTPICCLN
jgi:hypothetical protein